MIQKMIELPIYAKLIYGLAFLLILVYLIAIIVKPILLKQSLVATWAVLKEVFRQINSWQGWLSYGIVWLILSGAGLLIVGFIIKSHMIKSVATTIIIFWTGPGTPLVPIALATGLTFQRYVLGDKSVNPKKIAVEFKKAFKKED